MSKRERLSNLIRETQQTFDDINFDGASGAPDPERKTRAPKLPLKFPIQNRPIAPHELTREEYLERKAEIEARDGTSLAPVNRHRKMMWEDL